METNFQSHTWCVIVIYAYLHTQLTRKIITPKDLFFILLLFKRMFCALK
jgi:hypothetical protein